MLQLIPLALLPIGGALIFALGVAIGARRQNIWILGLAVLTAIVSLFPLLIDRLRPPEKRQLILSFISLSWIVSFVLPVYTEFYLNDGEMTGIAGLVGMNADDLVLGQLAALVGLVSLLFGFALPIGPAVGGAIPRPQREWSHAQCLAVAMVLIPLGLSVSLAAQFELIPERLGTGVLSGFATSYHAGIALLTVAYLRYRSRAALLMVFILIPPLMAMAFFTGSKSLLLQPLMMVAFAHIVVTRRIRAFWIVGGILAIIVIYPIAVFYRNVVAMSNQLSAVEVLTNPARTFGLLSAFTAQTDPTEYLTSGLEATGRRFDAVGITSIILRDTPDRVPFQGGWSIGYVFIAYVPRVLWADKPVTTALGQFVTDNYGPGPHITSHTAPSWVGEFYMNFGFPGIIVGCLTLGIIFRTVQSYLFHGRPTTPVVLATIVVISGLALSVEKSLVVTLNSITFNIIPIVMAHIGVVALTGGRPRTVPVQQL